MKNFHIVDLALASETDRLRRERDRFVAFAFSAAELLFELDDDWRILYAAGAHQQLTGQGPAAATGRPLLDLIADPDRQMVAAALTQLGSSGRLDPITLRLADGGKTALFGACRLPYAAGRVFVSLTKIKGQLPATRQLNSTDGGNGVWNLAQYNDVVTELAVRGNQEGRDERLTVLQLDGLDALKARTDDSVLQELFNEADAMLRSQSVGGSGVGRLAENKYGVVHDAAVESDHLADVIGDLSRDADPSSIGLSVARSSLRLANHGMNAEDVGKVITYTLHVLSENDVATLDIQSIDGAFDRLVDDTASRLTSFKQTVTQQDFHIAYQPIVALADRSVNHYEVLSRFNGTARPDETVLFAEQVGAIEDLDLAVCQYAISVIQERAKTGAVLHLAINISGRSLGSGIFVRLLSELLAKLEAKRSSLLIEVTETARLENLEEARRVLQSLHDQGHAICLDDFGSGAASFQYMQALPIDFVKIDGSYVQQYLDSAQDAAIIKSMISLSRELGIQTIAEMVETEAQAKGLRELGIDYGQGWLFGRPQRQVPTS